MDVAEFQQRIFDKLVKNGSLDALKASLRSRVILESVPSLPDAASSGAGSEPRQQSSSSSSSSLSLKRGRTLKLRAIDCLVSEYLSYQKFDLSRSVFVPEAGCGDHVSDASSVLSVPQWMLRNTSISQLENIVYSVSKTGGLSAHSVETQTSDGHIMNPLEHRFRQLETASSSKMQLEEHSIQMTIEERMGKMEREAEARYAKRLQSEMERWASIEANKIRAEEVEKYRVKLATIRADMEEQFASRVNAQTRREQEFQERNDRLALERDQEMFAARQRLLEYQARLDEREQEIKRREEIAWTAIREADFKLKERESELLKEKDAMQARIATGIHHAVAKLEAEWAEKKALLEKERAQFDDERLEMARVRTECTDVKCRNASILTSLEEARATVKMLENDVKEYRQENVQLRKREAILREMETEMALMERRFEEEQRAKENALRKYEELSMERNLLQRDAEQYFQPKFQEIEKYRTMVDTYREKTDEQQREIAKLRGEGSDWRSKYMAAVVSLDESQRIVRSFEAEINSYREQASESRRRDSAAAGDLEVQLSGLKRRIDDVERARDAAQRRYEDTLLDRDTWKRQAEMATSNATSSASSSSLSLSSLEREKNEEISRLRLEAAELKNRIASLERSIQESERTIVRLQSDVKAAREDLRFSQEECNALRSQLREARMTAASLAPPSSSIAVPVYAASSVVEDLSPVASAINSETAKTPEEAPEPLHGGAVVEGTAHENSDVAPSPLVAEHNVMDQQSRVSSPSEDLIGTVAEFRQEKSPHIERAHSPVPARPESRMDDRDRVAAFSPVLSDSENSGERQSTDRMGGESDDDSIAVDDIPEVEALPARSSVEPQPAPSAGDESPRIAAAEDRLPAPKVTDSVDVTESKDINYYLELVRKQRESQSQPLSSSSGGAWASQGSASVARPAVVSPTPSQKSVASSDNLHKDTVSEAESSGFAKSDNGGDDDDYF
eukprot:ANDGO_08416.mRNA.1 hypothetical protein (macronuclear)